MSEVTFRLARTEDLAAISEITTEFTHFEQNLNPSISLPLNPTLASAVFDWLSVLLGNPTATILVAEKDDTLAGFCIGSLTSPDNNFTTPLVIGKIILLWVDPKWRRQSLASALVEAIESHFKDNGAQFYELDHAYGNTQGKAFWVERGYLPASVTRRKAANTLA